MSPSQDSVTYVITYNEYLFGTVHLISCHHLIRAKRLVAWPQARGMTREGIRLMMNSGSDRFFPMLTDLKIRIPVSDDWDYDWDCWDRQTCVIRPLYICKHCLPDQYSVKAHLR
jgi:hypothetical protein